MHPSVESRAAGAAARYILLQCPPVLAKKIPNVDKNLIMLKVLLITTNK